MISERSTRACTARRRASGGRQDAGRPHREHRREQAEKEPCGHLLQAAGVEQGDGGEPLRPVDGLVEHEPAAVGEADQMRAGQVETGEDLRQPGRGVAGAGHGPALHAAAGVVDRVDRVDRTVPSEVGHLVVPGGGVGTVPVEQHDRLPRHRPAAIDPGGSEPGLHVDRVVGRPQCHRGVVGGPELPFRRLAGEVPDLSAGAAVHDLLPLLSWYRRIGYGCTN